ncbi:MAG: SLC13 family permease [Salinibacter sp.]
MQSGCTGANCRIEEGLNVSSGWPIPLVVIRTVALIVLLTEITSNTATPAAFLPILGAVAVELGENPFLLTIPVALGASCAFMLPVATPPNAIVYGSDLLTIPQMSRVGVWLNLLLVVLITALGYALLGVAFGVELGTLPGCAAGRRQGRGEGTGEGSVNSGEERLSPASGARGERPGPGCRRALPTPAKTRRYPLG